MIRCFLKNVTVLWVRSIGWRIQHNIHCCCKHRVYCDSSTVFLNLLYCIYSATFHIQTGADMWCICWFQATYIRLESSHYKLAMYLPHKVDEEKGQAKWDKVKEVINITLPIIRPSLEDQFKNAGEWFPASFMFEELVNCTTIYKCGNGDASNRLKKTLTSRAHIRQSVWRTHDAHHRC